MSDGATVVAEPRAFTKHRTGDCYGVETFIYELDWLAVLIMISVYGRADPTT